MMHSPSPTDVERGDNVPSVGSHVVEEDRTPIERPALDEVYKLAVQVFCKILGPVFRIFIHWEQKQRSNFSFVLRRTAHDSRT